MCVPHTVTKAAYRVVHRDVVEHVCPRPLRLRTDPRDALVRDRHPRLVLISPHVRGVVTIADGPLVVRRPNQTVLDVRHLQHLRKNNRRRYFLGEGPDALKPHECHDERIRHRGDGELFGGTHGVAAPRARPRRVRRELLFGGVRVDAVVEGFRSGWDRE